MHEIMQQVFLIRHGETEWSRSGRHTGRTDIPLTDNGRRLAENLAPLLGKESFGLVLTSPMQRARETPAQIHVRTPNWMIFRDGCPGGERPAQVAARVDGVIERVRSISDDVALFAHGHFFRVFAARWIGLQAQAGCNFLLDTATLNILSFYRGIPAVKRWNAPPP